jgi:protein-tyrosine phosphatase
MTIVQCHEVWPPLGADLSLYMLEVFGASLVVSSPYPAKFLQVELWTNLIWIDCQRVAGRKILIHCRAGIGRSGSLGIAYCFAKNPGWTYQQTLDYVWGKKPDIYPHSQLQASLETLFPRQGRPRTG